MKLKLFEIRLDEQHLEIDQAALNEFMEGVKVKKTALQFVPGEPDFWSILVFYKKKETTQVSRDELTDNEKMIYAALKAWRKDKADTLNMPEFMILDNAQLVSIVQTKPTTLAQFSEIKGLGEQKINRHGADIIAIINAFINGF